MVSMPQQRMWCYFYGGNSPRHIACVVLNLCGIIDSISRNISWPIGYRIFRGRCGFYRQYRLANSHDISQPIGLYIFRVRCVDCIVNIDSQTLVIYILRARCKFYTDNIELNTILCARCKYRADNIELNTILRARCKYRADNIMLKSRDMSRPIRSCVDCWEYRPTISSSTLVTTWLGYLICGCFDVTSHRQSFAMYRGAVVYWLSAQLFI